MPDNPNNSGPVSTPTEPRLTPRKFAVLSVAFAFAFIALTLLDPRITHACFYPEGRNDWWRVAIKFTGDLRYWLVIALLAFPFARDWRWPAGILGSAALAGGLAELLKLIIGRERPVRDFVIQNDAHYVFKPLLHSFSDGSNLGLPSSHAATAWGGATMLAILIHKKAPPLVWIAFALAAACAVSRVFTGAHFATDVLAGSFVGYLAAHTLALVSDTMSKPKPDAPAP